MPFYIIVVLRNRNTKKVKQKSEHPPRMLFHPSLSNLSALRTVPHRNRTVTEPYPTVTGPYHLSATHAMIHIVQYCWQSSHVTAPVTLLTWPSQSAATLTTVIVHLCSLQCDCSQAQFCVQIICCCVLLTSGGACCTRLQSVAHTWI